VTKKRKTKGTRAVSRSKRGRRGRVRPERAELVDLERYRGIIPDWAAFEASARRPEPTVLRVRTGRISNDALLERLAACGFALRPKQGLPNFFEVESGPGSVALTLEHWLGLFYVQQASTGVAAPLLNPQPGERVLDLCAAPGGKTTHAADLMQDRGCLVASEISESRIRGLLGNVYRLGHPNVFVVAGDGRDFPEGPLFDRVLVDAPCSGEGTLRRRGGKPPRQSASFGRYVGSVQRALLEKAIRLTRPGGTIVYATCTFAPEENEAVVDDILKSQPVDLEPITLEVAHAPGVTSFDGATYDARLEGAARIYPHHFDSGGLFLAKLRRLDDGAERAHGSADGGWTPVPGAFPESASAEALPDPGDETTGGSPHRLPTVALDDLEHRFAVDPAALADVDWIERGGRLWLHSLAEWPLEAWLAGPGRAGALRGDWRPISVGFRAIDFDSRDRPRPTNDLLRWLGASIGDRVFDIDREGMLRLASREAIAFEDDLRGPVALRYGGDVVGRGAATVDGLKSEIPKARSADLRRALQT
jgi:NOL1/NOP2/sun family putative RNA methylase